METIQYCKICGEQLADYEQEICMECEERISNEI